jgi:hypothetical protein
MNICTLKSLCEVLVPLFAIVSAVLWLTAAWTSRVSFFSIPMSQLDRAARRQAQFNGLAALCAGIAALLQFTITLMPVCRAFA